MVTQDVLIIATSSLVVELVVISLLSFSYFLKRRKMYRQHGIVNTAAVGLHLVTILSWMVWSFLAIFPITLGNFLHIITLAHVTLGIIAASLGVWLVGAWHLQSDVQKCFGRKRVMLKAITLWTITVVLGVVLYVAVILS